MSGRKKILYFMHIPWGWAKQRPHFIAEYLSKYFDVSIFFEKQYMGKMNLLIEKNISSQLKFNELFKLPLPDHKFFVKINSLLIKSQLKKVIDNYDIIWLTYPNLFREIKTIIPEHSKIIYDCMDDVLEFPRIKSEPDLRRATFNNEKDLCERSDILFTSSDYLKGKLLERYKRYMVRTEILVVNNALFLEEKTYNSPVPKGPLPLRVRNIFKRSGIHLSYIGTVSEWIDIDLLLESLEIFKNINYIFWGPREIRVPKHERLVYAGPIEHKYIFDIMDKSDALIMPFKISELVRSIDPVKLYEYIYSCKPSIAVEYDETLKFKTFVYLYRNKEEYFNLIKNLTEKNLNLKRSCEDHRLFAENNTWDNRINFIVEKIIQNLN